MVCVGHRMSVPLYVSTLSFFLRRRRSAVSTRQAVVNAPLTLVTSFIGTARHDDYSPVWVPNYLPPYTQPCHQPQPQLGTHIDYPVDLQPPA